MRDLQVDLLRLVRERDAERAARIKVEGELRRVRQRLSKALTLIAILKQRHRQADFRGVRARQRGYRRVICGGHSRVVLNPRGTRNNTTCRRMV